MRKVSFFFLGEGEEQLQAEREKETKKFPRNISSVRQKKDISEGNENRLVFVKHTHLGKKKSGRAKSSLLLLFHTSFQYIT